MCTDQQHKEQIDKLEEIKHALVKRPPIDETIEISATKPWIIDYHERRHIFIWLPTAQLTLSFEDYGSGIVPLQVWVNVGMPSGIRVTATGQTNNTAIMVRYTDEVVP